MAEFVQVPVSLIEEIRHTYSVQNLGPNVVDALDALLSQPTPTAEQDDLLPCPEVGDDGYNHWDTRALDRLLEQRMNPAAAPPSIADMAPGGES